MRFVARGILGLAAVASLVSAYGCGSDIKDDGPTGTGASGGASGAGGGGASGAGGGGTSECTQTAAVCYGNRERSAVTSGVECMANIDNSMGDRVQFRQTWSRVISPPGNTTDTVYGVLRSRAQINLPECAMVNQGGYIQISSWDRTNKTDITQQTVTTGYASYSGARPSPPPTGADVVRDGLCFIDWAYSYNGPMLPTEVNLTGRDGALPQPWKVKPVVSKRVMTDFTMEQARAMTIGEYAGIVFIDEEAGVIHGYSPLSYVTVLDNPKGGLATPIRDVEIKSQFNDKSFNCMGRFRDDKMTLAQNCDSGLDQKNPQWGCKDDAACPPAGYKPATGVGSDVSGPGTAPGYSTGYFLIVDLERVYSQTLSSTLCVSYPKQEVSIADGWAKAVGEGGWGLNCRGSPKWNPQAADDAGLPNGDWCSKTKGPASATCHDAYRSISYSTSQSFRVQEAKKVAGSETEFTGTCPVVP